MTCYTNSSRLLTMSFSFSVHWFSTTVEQNDRTWILKFYCFVHGLHGRKLKVFLPWYLAFHFVYFALIDISHAKVSLHLHLHLHVHAHVLALGNVPSTCGWFCERGLIHAKPLWKHQAKPATFFPGNGTTRLDHNTGNSVPYKSHRNPTEVTEVCNMLHRVQGKVKKIWLMFYTTSSEYRFWRSF